MIAAWMLSAVVFTTLLGIAAHAAEVALRGMRRPTRLPWLVALGASVTWPLGAPFVRRLIPSDAAMTAATLPSIQVVPDQLPDAFAWTARLDMLLLAMWIVASAIMIIRLVRALMHLTRIRRASRPDVVDGVRVLVSHDVGPAVVGVVQPSVLLPEALLDLDAPLRRLVLRHEEEHCRAGDPWVVIGSAIALALVPWNAPLWWIVRRARVALEVDCDARVLATEPGTAQYGKLLLLISQRQSVTPFAPMLAASSSHLERRITAMLPVRSTRRRTRIAVALVAMTVAGIAACSSRIADVASPTASVAPKSPTMVPAGQPYFEFQVEKAAIQVPGTGNIRYPDALRLADVQGEVLAQFVVDENGVAEPESYKVLKSDHQLFSNAVELALPNMRFAPAEIGGKKVRQLVQQPFTFSLSNKDAQQIPGTGNLRYPDALRSANVQGEVLAQFVVDVNGEVLPGSLRVLRSSHQLFTDAVVAALPSIRFEPAEKNGNKVRQLITRPFTFSLSKE